MLKMNMKKALALLASVLILCTLIPLSAFLANADDTNLVVNGDFETGDTTGWDPLWWASNLSIVEGRDGGSALSINCGQWQLVRQIINVEANTDYVVEAYAKGANHMSFIAKSCPADQNISGAQKEIVSGDDWTLNTFAFNSGNNTQIYLAIMGNAAGATVTLDDIVMTKVGGGSEPDEPGSDAPVLEMDFEDGAAVFTPGSVVAEGPEGSKCLKWSATGGWSVTYRTVEGVEKNTEYTISFKMKTSAAKALFVTIQDANWGPHMQFDFATTTEWKEYSFTTNVGDTPTADGKIFFKFQDTGEAQDVWVDDLVMVKKGAEPDEPDQPDEPFAGITNGDFETGDATGWGVQQSTAVSGDAAHSGSYGAHLKGNGGWGTMLERTIDVTAGQNYKLSFWIKANASGANIKFLDQNWQGAAVAPGIWFNSTEWTEKVIEFTAASDKFYLQFCGSGAAAEDLYVDDIVLTEIKDPSFDGYIYNGNFETGDTVKWENLYGSCTVEMVAGRNGGYAAQISCGQWQLFRQAVTVEKNTDYVVTLYAKGASNMALIAKSCPADQNIAGANSAVVSGADWTKTTMEFNSGDNTQVYLAIMGNNAGATGTFDDITMSVKGSEPDDPDNPDEPDDPIVPTYPTELINGDFEDGTNGWTVNDSYVSIDADAHKGTGALKLDNPSAWSEAALQTVSVQKDTNYVIKWYAKRVSGTGSFNMILMNADNVNYSVKSGQSWMNETSGDWTKYEIVINTGANDVIKFKITTETNNPGVILIDDITMIVEGSEPVDPTASLIKNGSFEDGRDDWSWGGDSALHTEDYYEGSQSAKLSHTSQWGEALSQYVNVEPNTDYVILFYTKRHSGKGVWNLNLMDGNTINSTNVNIPVSKDSQLWFDHETKNEWVEHRVEFNSGEVTKAFVKFSPEAADAGSFLVDYIGMWVKGNEPSPDDPDNPVVPPASPMYMTSFGVLYNRPEYEEDNVLENGSFESTGGQWKDGFTDDTVSIVKDNTTLSGSKSLYFNTSGKSEETKLIFWVDVEPETEYVFSTWLKGAFLSNDNSGSATIGVVKPDGTFLADYVENDIKRFLNGERQIVPTAWDDEWHLRSVEFNSGAEGKVGIALAGTDSQLWIDDMALYKATAGVQYVSENAGGSISLNYAIENYTCQDEDSLIPDPNFDTKDESGFWADSYGWRNGFLTFEENEYEYGTSLKYTETDENAPLSIIKTIKVKPHTDYTFSLDLKIIEDGWGKLVLIDGKKREPINFLEVTFDSFAYDANSAYYGWYTTASKFNTDVYDEIAIAVVDDGGEVLMDNMRLYESSKGDASVTDSFVPPPEEPTDDDYWYEEWPEDPIIEDEPVEDPIIDTPVEPEAPGAVGDPKPVDVGSSFLWLIIGGSALALAGGVVLVIILIKKKKKKADPVPEENG